MDINEKIAIMQAFAEGKKIECKNKSKDNWYSVIPAFNWSDCDYRIKPGQALRPYTNEELKKCLGSVIVCKSDNNDCRLLSSVSIHHGRLAVQTSNYTCWYTSDALLKDFTFLNGDPCGVTEFK